MHFYFLKERWEWRKREREWGGGLNKCLLLKGGGGLTAKKKKKTLILHVRFLDLPKRNAGPADLQGGVVSLPHKVEF